jgi:diguanylate cyclase (GGDEF)-like protein
MKPSKRRARLLGATRSLLATLAKTVPETDLLQAGIEALTKLIEVKYGAISLLDEAGNPYQFVYTGISAEEAKGMPHPPKGRGLLGAVIQRNAVIRLDNMADDPRSEGFPDGHPPMNSLLAVPISNLDQIYGRIYLCNKFDKSAFNDEDEELALSFANAISLILDNARKMDELKKEQSHLVHTALHDSLTNLPNRVLLCDRMGQALSHANRYQTQVAILFCDLDGFKGINDTLGHQAGDHVLKTMGERFVGCIRGNDTVARVGGDEFVFILSEVESVEHTGTVAQKILDTISQQISIDDNEVVLFGSIGIAIYPNDGEETELLLKNADTAMYKAKRRGKNNYQFFAEELLAECAGQAGAFDCSFYRADIGR